MKPVDDTTGTPAAPLAYEHEYDLPSGPLLGHGAALRVPVSEGPASFELGPVTESDTALMEAEPRVEPLRFMEFGTEPEDPAVQRQVHELDVPISAD